MAKLLATQPKLAVFGIGHTDDQRSFDANLLLAKRRAGAVRARNRRVERVAR